MEACIGFMYPLLIKSNRFCRYAAFKMLTGIKGGKIIIHEGPNSTEFGSGEYVGEITIINKMAYSEIAKLGEIGLGETYSKGWWTSSDLMRVYDILAMNQHLTKAPFTLASLIEAVRYRLNISNTAENNKKQVSKAYDVGNDFFSWMLGSTMLYTCAFWNSNNETLEQAQSNKIDLIINKLNMKDGNSIIDIGCGWGTLCNTIKERYPNSRVVGIAYAQEQIKYCKEHYPKCEFIYGDYRELATIFPNGSFDRIVSVGMMEHIGEKYLPVFMKIVYDLLKPGGRTLLHTMTKYDTPNSFSFSHKHIMPNVELPRTNTVVAVANTFNNLRTIHVENFGPMYAKTARFWRENLLANKEKVIAKYGEALLRSYDYCWCWFASAFASGECGLTQYIMEKAYPMEDFDYIIRKPT